MDINYEELFADFKKKVSTDEKLSASDITKKITDYFAKRFSSQAVLCSGKAIKKSEYLTDVLVTNFEPKNIARKEHGRFMVPEKEISALLAVESELGGEGGTSAGPVLKNVIEDFIKLLLLKCKYKVMIFSSVQLKDENEYLTNRVKTLLEVKNNTDSSNEEILLIHLLGSMHKSNSGNPRLFNDNYFFLSTTIRITDPLKRFFSWFSGPFSVFLLN